MIYSQSLKEIRDTIYTYQRKDNLENFNINIDDFKSHPYTFLKWRFYLETSSLLLFILVRTKIKPNHISLFYASLGILTLLFMSIPTENKFYLFFALFIAFTKTTIDACDGYIARLKNQKSLSGFVLDGYGAHINAIGFQCGIGFYLANYYNETFFLYLVFLIPFFYAIRLKTFAYSSLLNEIIENKYYLNSKHPFIKKEKDLENSFVSKLEKNNYKKIYSLFNSIFDDRARSVDLIILFFLIEIIFGFKLIEYIFYFLVSKHSIIVLINLFIVSNNDWLESKINQIR
jgi:hypothetical protein